MTKVRYLGQPVSNWYGLDLVTGQVLTVPARLVHKAVPPLFEPVEKAPPAAGWNPVPPAPPVETRVDAPSSIDVKEPVRPPPAAGSYIGGGWVPDYPPLEPPGRGNLDPGPDGRPADIPPSPADAEPAKPPKPAPRRPGRPRKG